MSIELKQWLRYAIAVPISPIIGEIVGLPFAFALDILWGHEVTGGVWALTVPNVLLTVIKAVATGFAAGWIAGRRGKLVAVLANFFFLEAALIISISLNRDILDGMSTVTKPALWVWIGLIPALFAGHFAVKYKHLGVVPVLASIGATMGIILQIGALAFHLYTVVTAFELNGLLGGVLAFVMPLLSELWYSWKLWDISNTFWNIYTLRFLLLIVWGICAMLILIFAGNLEARERSTVAIGS